MASARTPAYAELLCRTHYSFLRGASSPAECVDRAAELGLAALGVCDRDGVYGMPKAYDRLQQLRKERPGAALPKLLVGAELTLAPAQGGDLRLNLLATDRAGYGRLCRLLTASHAGKPKGQAALAWSEFRALVAPSGATAKTAGLLALPDPTAWGERPERHELRELLETYVPLVRALDGLDARRTLRAEKLARDLGAGIVATGDVHYHVAERRKVCDTLSAIRENAPLKKIGYEIFSNAERTLKSAAEMQALFKDVPGAIERTLEVASRCTFCPSELRYHYPSEWIPAGETAESYLARLTWEGARKRYPEGVPESVRRQIEHELDLVRELKFADYFLTIWEIVDFARSQKILCQGRGSAANSIICYCLGITAVDPVQMNLLFERFISAERNEPPDIDVDFEHERREEVIQHVYDRYGRDRAGMVAALITYRSRSVRRDVSKALEVDPKDPRVEPFIEELRGFPRHLSIHSGGFTLSADALIETVPIEPARMEGRTIVQWDKEDLATIGLLKVDLLALGMLTALRKTLDLVQPKRALTLATIPHDDAETYAMIGRAETVGTFQIESRAQMSMLRRLKPKNFYDLVIEVAIVRPGPIVGQMVHPYLRRRQGQEAVSFPDPRLEPILGRTLGVPLFQEQVMKIAMVLAGFTPGEADELRRSIAAWRSTGSVERMGRMLMSRLLAEGLPQEFVERIFKQVQGFAEYGFPESHAASFALLAYASCYLKCHYPAEFTASVINSQPMGFYANHTLIEEVKRAGVPVYPVDPNASDWDCTLVEGVPTGIRVGLRVVHGLSEAEGQALVLERKQGGKFRSLPDFLARVKLSPRALQSLAMGDAFKGLGLTQREALWELLRHEWLRGLRGGRAQAKPQLSLFTDLQLGRPEQGGFTDLSSYEAVQADYASYGLSTRGHPMWALKREPEFMKLIPPTTTTHVKRTPSGRGVRVAGLIIVRQRPHTAKGTCFATLEDEEGFLDLIFHERVYERFEEVLLHHPFLIVTGRVQTDGQPSGASQARGADSMLNVIVTHIRPLLSLGGPASGAEPHRTYWRVDSYDFR